MASRTQTLTDPFAFHAIHARHFEDMYSTNFDLIMKTSHISSYHKHSHIHAHKSTESDRQSNGDFSPLSYPRLY